MPRTRSQKKADAKSQKNIYANLKIRKEILLSLQQFADSLGIDKQQALTVLLNKKAG